MRQSNTGNMEGDSRLLCVVFCLLSLWAFGIGHGGTGMFLFFFYYPPFLCFLHVSTRYPGGDGSGVYEGGGLTSAVVGG